MASFDMPPVSEVELRRAVRLYPVWLAEGYVAWVREAEAAGERFTGAVAAVRHARAEIARRG